MVLATRGEAWHRAMVTVSNGTKNGLAKQWLKEWLTRVELLFVLSGALFEKSRAVFEFFA